MAQQMGRKTLIYEWMLHQLQLAFVDVMQPKSLGRFFLDHLHKHNAGSKAHYDHHVQSYLVKLRKGNPEQSLSHVRVVLSDPVFRNKLKKDVSREEFKRIMVYAYQSISWNCTWLLYFFLLIMMVLLVAMIFIVTSVSVPLKPGLLIA